MTSLWDKLPGKCDKALNWDEIQGDTGMACNFTGQNARVKTVFNKPFPLYHRREVVPKSLLFGAFVFLFLYLFRPFHFDDYKERVLLMAAIFGLVTFGVAIVAGTVFQFLIVPMLQEEKWTLGKQIIWRLVLLLLVALANGWVMQTEAKQAFSFSFYLVMLSYVLLMGVFPITIVELFAYNRYLRENVATAQELSGLLDEKPEPSLSSFPEQRQTTLAEVSIAEAPPERPAEQNMVTLRGENANESVSLSADHVLALQSVDNYVTIYYREDRQVKSVLLRNTLTNMAAQLSGSPWLLRTHRAYLVNMRQILHVAGNAQGYKLTVKGLELQVPVSRGNIPSFRELAEQYRSNEVSMTA